MARTRHRAGMKSTPLALALLLAACADRPASAPAANTMTPTTGAPNAAAPPAAAAQTSPAPHTGPTWLDDDVAAALAAAKAAGKVVLFDAWAPWCHTCLSMQRDVLHDASLKQYEDRVVFAAVDTDRPESAPFVAKFPVRVWPTFFVVDPQDERVLALHGGSMSLAETTKFLDDALRTRDPAAATDPLVKALLEGHAAAARKDWATAAQRYVAAADGPRRAEAIMGAMRAYSAAKDDGACVDFGGKHVGTLGTSATSADLVGYLSSCAERLPPTDARRGRTLDAARAELQRLTTTPPAGASIDDRADAFNLLADVADAQGDAAAVKAAHERRLALLEADAKARTNVAEARVHDYARLVSYLALGRGAEAVAMLQERTKQLPTSYEAWARLTTALQETKRYDEAAAAAQKAIELSYGPRRLRYRTQLADIHAARGDKAAEQAAAQALVDDAEKLAAGHRDDAAIAAAKARLAKAQAAAPPQP